MLETMDLTRALDRDSYVREVTGRQVQLRELGYQTIALEMSEFQKMDGGLSCLSLRF